MKSSDFSDTPYNARLPSDREKHADDAHYCTHAEVLPPGHYYGVFLVGEVVAAVKPLARAEREALSHAKAFRDTLQSVKGAKGCTLAEGTEHISDTDCRGCCCCFHIFSILNTTLSPGRESNPGACAIRGGRCAVAILADRRRLKTNKYLCMITLIYAFVNAPPINDSRKTPTPSNAKSTTHTDITATAAIMYFIIFFIIF